MPVIDLGAVVGPAGATGATGDPGPQGIQGNPGPNQVTGNTSTNLNGILKGNGTLVGTATFDTTPTADSPNLVSSGTVNAAIVNAYQRTVNPNLLDNWWFPNAVNQRGASSYPNDGYCIDRWYRKWFTAFTVSTSGISMTAGSSSVGQLVQEIEILNNHLLRAGKTITFSVLVTSVTGTGGRISIALGTAINNNSSNLVSTTFSTPGLYKISVTLPESQGSRVNFIIQAELSSTINVLAAKVELGSAQTLCCNNGTDENPVWVLNEVPNYAEELAKCQRYLWIIKATDNNHTIAYGSAADTTHAYFCLGLPVTMRQNKAFTVSTEVINDTLPRVYSNTANANKNASAIYSASVIGNQLSIGMTIDTATLGESMRLLLAYGCTLGVSCEI